MPQDHRGRSAVVTGSSSGIGRAVARRLAHEGATVFGLDLEPCEEPGITSLVCDVGDETMVQAAFREIGAQTEALDYLVNVAGVLTLGPKHLIQEQPLDQWDAMLRTNLTSMLLVIREAHPYLQRAPSPSIVNLSSDQSLKGRPASAPYGVAKAGVNALTKIAALEMAGDGIRVNAIACGAVRTNILQSLIPDEETRRAVWQDTDRKLPLGLAEPEDVAGLVSFLLSPDARRVTGSILLADSGQMLL